MNKNNLNYFTEFGINSNKIHLLPHFTFMNSSRMLKKKNYALFVGGFSRNKGFHTLIKAFNEIDYQLKIIGQVKNKDEELKKLNINLRNVGFINKKRNIENIGFVENNQLSKYYAEANFTIFPSEAEETFGYVIIESFANFTPVLSSNQKSLKKIVKNEYNGLLFKSGDHLDLKNKIEWLVRNTSFTKNMSFNAKKDFDNNYSSKIHFSALMSLYKKAISLQTK
jgi:glycosyltransferase involved in cell wall biosynthesis